MRPLSVVIAAGEKGHALEACLTSLQQQEPNGRVETIVVDGTTGGTAFQAVRKFPYVKLIRADSLCLIPELWAHGARHATGEVVAFTTGHFVPAEDWVSELLSQLSADYAAVGGAIEQSEPASLSRWAVYFCRYAGYMSPFPPQKATQIPGDNSAYKRWVLDEYAPMIQEGFWEYEINRKLVADGHALLLSPSMRVHHMQSSTAGAFCRERFLHGRLFGGNRRVRASFVRRLAYVASLPLIPALQLSNMGRKVISKGRHRREFILSMPWITLFVSCWSLGEYFGYLFGGGQREGAGL